MRKRIHLLDEDTVNRIAAGEVVERPLSIVKELVENAIDAGADALTIEIKGGGIDLIRVTDNGSGIAPSDVRAAFMAHATSKIETSEDLYTIKSLGFRGEALSSIAAVCQVEIITKIREEMTAVRYRADGGEEVSFEEIGAPDGTTFVARNLFFHTPARRKFLRTAVTEAGYITEFVEHLCISYPEISVKYVVNGTNRLVTTGNGNRVENIYKVFGRDTADNLLEVKSEEGHARILGYAAKPLVVKNNRDHEIFFVNGHEIKDKILQKAVEEAYRPYLMQHKFPFVILMIEMDPSLLDVNVHPRKTEVRFVERNTLFEFVRRSVISVLSGTELINRAEYEPAPVSKPQMPVSAPEPFETRRRDEYVYAGGQNTHFVSEDDIYFASSAPVSEHAPEPVKDTVKEPVPVQQRLDMKIMVPDNKPYFRLVGQVFDTYWIIEYEDKMYIIDQHAAHEKVMYEKFVKDFKERRVASQFLNPALIVTLSGRQEVTLSTYMDAFNSMGFEIEHFEGSDYALRAVPSGFMSLENKDIFTGLIDELGEETGTEDVSIIHDRLAQMSCKAAVKGNNRLSEIEADALLTQLLSLENPYNCPHGRPTMIEYTKKDLEKKFKRIV
ncbi:MAG: DNA mismatch repair endonuclease MutL [Lachnospiraceae bacterium]|nr:DNA mismatch repair endonuclease MutL [Lachnospiraceae bacterium]